MTGRGYDRSSMTRQLGEIAYSQEVRLRILDGLRQKILSRRSMSSPRGPANGKLFFVQRYSHTFARVGTRGLLASYVRRLRTILPDEAKQVADFDVVVAHKTGVSTFLDLYTLNTPWTGIGRCGLF